MWQVRSLDYGSLESAREDDLMEINPQSDLFKHPPLSLEVVLARVPPGKPDSALFKEYLLEKTLRYRIVEESKEGGLPVLELEAKDCHDLNRKYRAACLATLEQKQEDVSALVNDVSMDLKEVSLLPGEEVEVCLTNCSEDGSRHFWVVKASLVSCLSDMSDYVEEKLNSLGRGDPKLFKKGDLAFCLHGCAYARVRLVEKLEGRSDQLTAFRCQYLDLGNSCVLAAKDLIRCPQGMGLEDIPPLSQR